MVTITSREYKLMLRAERFAGDEDALLLRTAELWADVERTIAGLVLDVAGDLDEIAKRRRVRFHDTEDHRLRRNDYVFRERFDERSGDRVVTLKFRHPDRYVVQDRDMRAKDPDRGKTKFEQDIKPPFVHLHSFSTKQKISSGKNLDELGDPGRLFPGLPDQLDAYDEDEPIAVVGGFTARELVVAGASLQLGTDPELEAKCSVTVWYDDSGDPRDPVVAELSFKYGDDDEDYAGEAAARAYEVFLALQSDALVEWVDPKPTTKTAYAYGRA